jgi:putative membrane protein
MMMGNWFGTYGWIWMVVNAIFWLGLIGGLVWLVIWAVRRSGSGQKRNDPLVDQSAKDIAQMRYARGEISRDQYQELLEDLNR